MLLVTHFRYAFLYYLHFHIITLINTAQALLIIQHITISQPMYVSNLLPVSIHSHIQWSIFAQGEASFCLIHLHGGTASIQQDSINAAWLNVHVWQQVFKLTEPAKHWFHMTTEKELGNEIVYLETKTTEDMMAIKRLENMFRLHIKHM